MNVFFWMLLDPGVPIVGPVFTLALVAPAHGWHVAKALIGASVKNGQLFWCAIGLWRWSGGTVNCRCWRSISWDFRSSCCCVRSVYATSNGTRLPVIERQGRAQNIVAQRDEPMS
ncbi:hypothetical protein LMG27177_00206 [Paraburkholderia fynbosensis]|uniref:Uncharacterized protein n=1 Tax=Paraburkholderia fynbosensis TaxID=1200993 RepID=A0A6J5FCN1_9BURK|nr:hypothetical protein LMG27177_00206 [Paraburkholderia fynbosensis]